MFVFVPLILKLVSYIIHIKLYEINFEDLVISTAIVWDVTPSSLVDMVQAAGVSKTLAILVYLPDMTAFHSIRVFVFNTVTVIVEPPS